MKTWIANPVRFFSHHHGYLCRAAVLMNDWGDPPEVIHWTDHDGLHVQPMPKEMYDDLLVAIERQGEEIMQ